MVIQNLRRRSLIPTRYERSVQLAASESWTNNNEIRP